MRTIELLQTKLQRPRVPRHFVPRPRLVEATRRGRTGTADVGLRGGRLRQNHAGEFLDRKSCRQEPVDDRQPVAWISLDERDSDLGFFLRYLIAGLRTIFPDACPATSSLLGATRQPPLDVLCTTLINEITSLPHDFIVVLDDYHRITGTVVPELFREFERHWPQRMHLVLISRYIPALALASWRAKGQLTEIRARDLRFRPDEAAAYLEMALQRPLSQEAIALVERRTEGWAAGVQLASLLLRDTEDPEGLLVGLSGDDAGFAEYLMDDVLPHQPAAILSFLLQSAIPDQFCVSLCEAVISIDDPEWSVRRCIDWVERHNLFVSSLDNHQGMVRISPDVSRWAAPTRQGRARPRPCSRVPAQGSRLVREPWPDGRSRAARPGSQRS